MSADPAQRIRQLEFERDYAEAHVGRLYVQNQHQAEALTRLAEILQRHDIDPQTGEQNLRMAVAGPTAVEEASA